MQMPLLLILFFSLFQTDVPFKQNSDFEIKLDYRFKPRPGTDGYSADGTKLNASTGVLPYLILNLKILKLDTLETKIKVNSNLVANIINKKVTEGDVFPLDMGFTEDVKDKVTAHLYTVTFLTAKKEPVSKIVITIDEDGNFFVNNERRGKL
ncbi:MAG TPA: hypothetical protein VIM65_01990 [Cyclobacteriaceae bacterium]